ncbi:MAG TPA: hypothetical protein LFW21_01960 [Rickettsia endosymbiont of Pyrocoelia pectoralis]|nr:hypothetical protein [Rickettsia endosymbiont of Pyrocoelia pectoralis]
MDTVDKPRDDTGNATQPHSSNQ